MKAIWEQEDVEIIRTIENCSTSIIFVSEAFANFKAFCYADFEEEYRKQLKESPLNFYAICFQNVMVLQILNLFETFPQRDKKRANSSLIKINEILHQKYQSEYSIYSKTRVDLLELMELSFFRHLKTLRDKSYAHSENHDENMPLRFKFFTATQIEQFSSFLLRVIEIFNRYHGFYGRDITFHNIYNSTTPMNFLKGYFRNRDFFKKNFTLWAQQKKEGQNGDRKSLD